jgi:purine nucleosidase
MVSADGAAGGTRRIILDCDTGIDDTFAIFYAAFTPGIELVALTSVWGNVPVEIAARNNLSLTELLGLEIPVAAGAAGPLTATEAAFAFHVHGDDGQGNVGIPEPTRSLAPQHGARLIVELARAHPGALDLVAVGPLTNLALALGLEPQLPSLLRSVTVMGGAADAPGNRTPVAEANVWHDPEAAAAVVNASWDLTLVPLDVTMTVLLTEEHRRRLAAAGTPASLRAAAIADFYFDYFHEHSYAHAARRCTTSSPWRWPAASSWRGSRPASVWRSIRRPARRAAPPSATPAAGTAVFRTRPAGRSACCWRSTRPSPRSSSTACCSGLRPGGPARERLLLRPPVVDRHRGPAVGSGVSVARHRSGP